MATEGNLKDVQTWLQSLNLGEYIDTFHSNGYFHVHDCTAITDSELHSLGIHQTGYKKRILNSISNMGGSKPVLPPRTPPPGSSSPKPSVPARKITRPPSLDNLEYYAVDGANSEMKPKPTVSPRQTTNNHSVRPILPPRKEKPQPTPRIQQIPNLRVGGQKAVVYTIPPSLPSSDEDDLFSRPLPPVPGVEEPDGGLANGGFLDDLPEPPMLPPPLAPEDMYVPPLPERPPVIGAEDPPQLPDRPKPGEDEIASPMSAPVMLPPLPPLPDRPDIPLSPELLPPPPQIPKRPLLDPLSSLVQPPGQLLSSAGDVPSHHEKRQSPPLPAVPPALPERPPPPPIPIIPPVPARPAISYISDTLSGTLETSPEDDDPFNLLNRPVPLPPPIPPQSQIERNNDLSRRVPIPPSPMKNEYQEYEDKPTLHARDDEVDPAVPRVSSGTSDEEVTSFKKFPFDPYSLGQETQEITGQDLEGLYDVPNPLAPPESNYDVPTPRGVEAPSVYSVPPPPRRQPEPVPEAGSRDSIYDTPSSNRRESSSDDLRVSGSEPVGVPPTPPPSANTHMFNATGAPPHYTNVSAQEALKRSSRTSGGFLEDSDSKDYIPLSSAYSGQPTEQSPVITRGPYTSPPPIPTTPVPPPIPTTPIPPPRLRNTVRKSDYILLSETTTQTPPSDINANRDHGQKGPDHTIVDGVSYTRPMKASSPPMKPARVAPRPPPPPRQSSLNSLSSPKKTAAPVNLPDIPRAEEDEYHLVDPPQDRSESDDDDFEDTHVSIAELQKTRDLNRISDCSMGMGDAMQRQENLRKSYREMRKSMHQKTLQKVAATYNELQLLPSLSLEGGDNSGLEKTGFLNLYTQSGSQANRRRYVVFTKNELRYYASEKELNVSKGIVPLGTMRDVKYNTNSKEKNFKLDLHTNGKILHFGTENLEECIKWASTLMQAILSYVPPPGGFPIGGDMSSPDKEGYLKLEGSSSKRYIAIKGEMLCMYKSMKDFDDALAICDIPMKLANIKEEARNRLKLTTPSAQYFLTADSPIEAAQWRGAMEEAIQEGLSSREFLEIIWQNESNRYCAECSAKDPDWASINFGIVVCKACSGGHRFLGVHLSKVRSLKMDEKIWTEQLLKMMVEIGNKNSNAFWESKLHEDDEAKLHPGDTSEDRQTFIKAKYQEFKYCERISAEKNFLSRSLQNAVNSGNLRECIKLLFSGADPLFKDDAGRSALDMAKQKDLVSIHELLKQNCESTPSPSQSLPTVPELPREPTPPPPKETSQEAVKISGYLRKTGSNRKDFQKRYCVLERGVFTYYADEKAAQAAQPKSFIEGFDMILIAVAEPKPNHQFCFDICTSSGRAYLFSAETEEERKRWMVALGKCQTLDVMWPRLESFEFAGYLKKKEGAASTQWQRLWFILQGKFMFFFSAIKNDEDFIDLRKLKSLSMDDSQGESEEVRKISFVMPKKNLYFTAETEEARDLWYRTFERAFKMAGPMLDDQPLSETDVPLIITSCINFVVDHEGLDLEGVYRKSGSATAIRAITACFNDAPRHVSQFLKENEYGVHDVTSALKKYFRDLPDPLLTQNFYPEWIQASGEEHNTKLEWYKQLLESLPTINYAILKNLISHLRKIDANREKNSMDATNLGTVFGPTLMATSDPMSSNFQNAQKEINVIRDMITYYNWLFDVETESADEIKRRKEEEALKKFDILNKQQVVAEFIVEIYNGRKPPKGEGTSFSIKIAESTTAQELIEKSISQGKVRDRPNLALFEVVCRGDMERLLHSYEYVLQDIMGWNTDFGKDSGNYMCVMEDYLTPRIELYMRVLSSSDFVKFQEGRRGFKKLYFELNQNVLNAYKDRLTSSVTYQWKVSEMKIYYGHDKKKTPPTQHCLAFITPKEQGFKQLSFDTEEALNTWLGALFKSKSLEQATLPIPSTNFNAPFTRPQEPRDGPNTLRQITSHLKRWSRSPSAQTGLD